MSSSLDLSLAAASSSSRPLETTSVVLSPSTSVPSAPASTPAIHAYDSAATPTAFSLADSASASSLAAAPSEKPASQALRWSLSHEEMAEAVGEKYKPLCKEGETILTNYYGNEETGFLYGLTYLKKENGVFRTYHLYDIYACDVPVVFRYGFLPPTWYRRSRRVDARVPSVLGARRVDGSGRVSPKEAVEDNTDADVFESSSYKVPKHVHPSTPSSRPSSKSSSGSSSESSSGSSSE